MTRAAQRLLFVIARLANVHVNLELLVLDAPLVGLVRGTLIHVMVVNRALVLKLLLIITVILSLDNAAV